MKIYFSAAIAQKDEYGVFYKRIVKHLEKDNHLVYQDTTVVSMDEAVNKSDEQRANYYRQVIRWISRCDVVVLEVSFPSTLHIGHEISLALQKNKPVIALYYHGNEPSFFLGLQDDKVFWSDYSNFDLEQILEEGLLYARSQLETRFNLYLSPKHMQHLTKVTQTYKMPRSAYIRKLIDEDMKLKKN